MPDEERELRAFEALIVKALRGEDLPDPETLPPLTEEDRAALDALGSPAEFAKRIAAKAEIAELQQQLQESHARGHDLANEVTKLRADLEFLTVKGSTPKATREAHENVLTNLHCQDDRCQGSVRIAGYRCDGCYAKFYPDDFE